uniref:Uncharacterized protein n=1 Tax=Anopheles melas TaxID=34690 RepID=A0A182U504_9DIPT
MELLMLSGVGGITGMVVVVIVSPFETFASTTIPVAVGSIVSPTPFRRRHDRGGHRLLLRRLLAVLVLAVGGRCCVPLVPFVDVVGGRVLGLQPLVNLVVVRVRRNLGLRVRIDIGIEGGACKNNQETESGHSRSLSNTTAVCGVGLFGGVVWCLRGGLVSKGWSGFFLFGLFCSWSLTVFVSTH